jgi:acyl carrier protein
MSIKKTIYDEINEVAQLQSKQVPPLDDNLVLLESGLDSLCFAILVVRLEDKLGIDPFSQTEELTYPVTLADFVELYEHALR